MANHPRGAAPARFSRLDFKVGVRMLARYPGLTLVGTVAVAFAIALGSLYFEGLNKWQNPRLPVRDGHRVVSVHLWDADAMASEARMLHDFARWRGQVRTVDLLGAALPYVRNLATEDGRVEPVRGAEVTASAFGLMETAPALGRALTARDERPGEPPVAVLSHALWKARFGGDPGVVGRTVRVGSASATVVGVMPEGFGFPVNQRVWTPLRVDAAGVAPRTGPPLSVFGRLAPGASMDEARAELGALGARAAAQSPATHRHLRPRVAPYAQPLAESGEARFIVNTLYAANAVFLLLLAIVCVNVATLVFARTATRGWEITVRTALGASRGRIVAQLFVEALVLTGVAALLGLLAARVAMRVAVGMLAAGDSLPFWIDDSLSWRTVAYAAVLALAGAAIIGVLPALRVTRANVQDALRSEGAARSGLRFGGFWTGVIVVQVALTVALLPLAAGGVFVSNRFQQRADAIGAGRFLTASVAVDREYYAADSAAFAARGRLRFAELERRLRAEPGVESVAFADRVPVMDQFKYSIEVDTAAGAPAPAPRRSTVVNVAGDYFAAFGTGVVAGRDFTPLDYEGGRALIVNQSFARHVFGGRNPVGRRVRIVAGEDATVAGKEWYEVVGMVRDFGWQLPAPEEQSAIYRPRAPLPGARTTLVVRVRDPEAFAPRLRAVALEVDPTLRLTDVQPMARVGGGEARINWAITSVAWLVTLMVMLLSATGIHALMSFTVSRRTREIGIRAALGARSGNIVAGIFSRAFLQIGLGIAAGAGVAALVGLDSTQQVVLVVAAAAVMLAVGLAACAVPLRRALTINPTDALRADG